PPVAGRRLGRGCRPERPRRRPRRCATDRGDRQRPVLGVGAPGRVSRARAARAPRWLSLLLVVGLLLAGCEEGTDTGGGTDTGDGGAYPNLPRIELTPEEQASYEALIVDLLGTDGLSGGLGTFWPSALASVAIGALYEPPAGVSSYEGAPQQSGCGPLATENAWYCSAD